MNVVIPAAGRGTRLRPHTLHRPKPLMHVGGDTMIAHVLRSLAAVDLDTICLVVGHLGEQLDSFASSVAAPHVEVVTQTEPLGQAHAVLQARRWLVGPVLIAFPDTILDVDLGRIGSGASDGTLFAHHVDDPSRFGVVITDPMGLAAELVEKPADPVSSQAVVGLYHVARGEELATAIDDLIAEDRAEHGEYYLLDALQRMIDRGARFEVSEVRAWADCGVPADLLAANRQLLRRLDHTAPPTIEAGTTIYGTVSVAADAHLSACVVGPNVFVGPGCRLENSRIGPDVSLAEGAIVVNSEIRNAVAEAGVQVHDSVLDSCLLGADTRVVGGRGSMSLGDRSVVGGR